MPLTLIPTFTMRRGREAAALKLIRAVKKEAQADQPGTLVYLVHRVLDGRGRPTRKLCFYERYASADALKTHLRSPSWQAVVANWRRCFEGASPKSIKSLKLIRIGAFARAGAIPTVVRRRR